MLGELEEKSGSSESSAAKNARNKSLPKKASKLSKEFGEESDEEYSDDIPVDDDASGSSNDKKMIELKNQMRESLGE